MSHLANGVEARLQVAQVALRVGHTTALALDGRRDLAHACLQFLRALPQDIKPTDQQATWLRSGQKQKVFQLYGKLDGGGDLAYSPLQFLRALPQTQGQKTSKQHCSAQGKNKT